MDNKLTEYKSIDDETPEAWNKATANLRALDRQEGGGHYKSMGIQPFELVQANFGYDGLRASVYTKVNKYLARDKGDFEKHIADLRKSIHCLEIQLEAALEEQRGGRQ